MTTGSRSRTATQQLSEILCPTNHFFCHVNICCVSALLPVIQIQIPTARASPPEPGKGDAMRALPAVAANNRTLPAISGQIHKDCSCIPHSSPPLPVGLGGDIATYLLDQLRFVQCTVVREWSGGSLPRPAYLSYRI